MPDDPPSFAPDANLDLVGAGWWLEVRCGCGRSTQIPIKLLVREHGPHARAPRLLARMRCSQCGSPPTGAEWIDDPRGGAAGTDYPPPRRVPVA